MRVETIRVIRRLIVIVVVVRRLVVVVMMMPVMRVRMRLGRHTATPPQPSADHDHQQAAGQLQPLRRGADQRLAPQPPGDHRQCDHHQGVGDRCR